MQLNVEARGQFSRVYFGDLFCRRIAQPLAASPQMLLCLFIKFFSITNSETPNPQQQHPTPLHLGRLIAAAAERGGNSTVLKVLAVARACFFGAASCQVQRCGGCALRRSQLHRGIRNNIMARNLRRGVHRKAGCEGSQGRREMAPKAGLHDSRVEAAAEQAAGGEGVQTPREHFGKHDLKKGGKR